MFINQVNKSVLHSTLALVALTTTHMALANEEAPVSVWKSDAELGFVQTTGNSETENTNGKFNISNERDKWRHEVKVATLNASSDSVRTAERYNVSGKTNYKFSEHHYSFISIDYEKDHFSGYDRRVAEAIGYGYRLNPTATSILDLFIGPGARQSKLDDGSSENETIAKLGLTYLWKISETSEFSEELTTEAGEDTTTTKSVTALKSTISGKLSMKLAYTIKDTSEVPAGFEERDTELSVSLVYNLL